jgi:selenocysteine lyase/cysteine desulfurase
MLSLVNHIRRKNSVNVFLPADSELDVEKHARKIRASKSLGDIKRENSKREPKRDFKRDMQRDTHALGRSNSRLSGRTVLDSQQPGSTEFERFLEDYPEYPETSQLDELRKTEFSRLDKLGHVYLDYTGGSLYPENLVRRHAEVLANGVFGNPHSTNPTSLASTVFEEQGRRDILEFFGADPQEYNVIMTSNASGAMKLVGESYPFSKDNKLLLTWDEHNSVNGVREFANTKGSEVVYVPLEDHEARINKDLLEIRLDQYSHGKTSPGLFILSGQSNITGVKPDLAHARYAKSCGWDVLLDASALAPTSQINLRKYPVDFMAISFYKMFGYPTGMGCLLMRKEVSGKMQRPWFGGGTVEMVTVPTKAFTAAAGHRKFEDGTINYLSFYAISLGLSFLQSIQKPLSLRVTILTDYVLKELIALRHKSTGRRLAIIAGPQTTYMRGGTIAFYLQEDHGKLIPHLLVDQNAQKRNISLRSGCMCNPGAAAVALGKPQYLNAVKANMTVGEFVDHFENDLVLLVRMSIGIATNWEDCVAFINFIKEFLDPHIYQAMKNEYGDDIVTSLC